MHVTLYPRINVFYHEGRCKPIFWMINEETQVTYSEVKINL